MKRRRPGWRIDAKWIVGVLLTMCFIPTLTVYCLYQVTAEKPAKKVIVPLIRETMGVDQVSAEAFEQLTEVAQLRPGERFEIPNWPVKLTLLGRDIAGKTEEKLKTLILDQTFDLVYKQGFEAPLEGPPEISMTASVINFFSQDNHRRLGTALGWLFTVCVILAIPLVLLSFRFGKLTSLGVSLIFSALPGTILSLIFRGGVSGSEVGSKDILANLGKVVLPVVLRIHLIVLIGGLVLALIGVAGGVIFWFLSEGRETKIVERSLPR